MLVLGINEGANSSVVVCRDGKVIFALQEERVTRQKEFCGFPEQALAFTIKHLRLKPSRVDAIAFSNLTSPGMSRAAYLRAADAHASGFWESLVHGRLTDAALQAWHQVPEAWRVRIENPSEGGVNRAIDAKLVEMGFDGVKVMRYAHHATHAATAYFGMRHDPETPHLVLTLDSGGDGLCSQVYLAEAGRMVRVAQTPAGHSVGDLYAAVTHMLGMTPREQENSVMGLAPFAAWKALNKPLKAFNSYLDLDPENPLCFKRLVPEDTGYIEPRMTHDLRRVRFDAVAGAIQLFTEDLLVRWVLSCVKKTGVRNLVVAGGVFQNARANKLISELKELNFFDVLPACGDESLAFGAAWRASIDLDPEVSAKIGFDDLFLGPEAGFDLKEAKAEFADRLDFEPLDKPEATIAALLAEGKVVARCSGPMEFGGRGLGNRSLLADAADRKAAADLDWQIERRDFWMSGAVAVPVEQIDEYVKVPRALPRPRVSPFMMHGFAAAGKREELAGAVHPHDGAVLLQVVGQAINPGFHAILEQFAAKTERSALLNGTFALPGAPIVMGARDAMDAMLRSNIEYLVIDKLLVTKKPADKG
jgi:carbamoyltransferase